MKRATEFLELSCDRDSVFVKRLEMVLDKTGYLQDTCKNLQDRAQILILSLVFSPKKLKNHIFKI